MGKIADPGLAEEGEKNFLWAKGHMTALSTIASKYATKKPLKGVTVGVCLHVTKETSVLVDSLLIAGAEVKLAAANPLSTQDDIAAYLSTRAEVWAWRGESGKDYDWCVGQVVSSKPDVIIDDGADLHVAANLKRTPSVLGGCEETTTGVLRVKALEKDGKLGYPIVAINNAKTKFLFDNRFGTGQSTFDGILRATSLLIAGKKVVVVGYGWVGKGVAKRARGLDANVTVVEVDPIKALEAHLDGFLVANIGEAARYGEIFVTCTGQKHVISYSAVKSMRDGAILSNAGHFDVEIDVKSIMDEAKSVKQVRPNTDEIALPNGKRIYLLGKGRIVNLVAAEGHPPEVMQMSFANQFMSALYVYKNHSKLQKKVLDVPPEIEEEVAMSTLRSLGITIDRATKEQLKYAESWALE
ncbi:MAG: adenosylhomocysteinase [Nitrososphaerota archaeon]|nr:adenosylhomocysteinase [Nitrososphaerota archaeon]MDG6966415.1 adenosylhomocysteinase [Nitrososphaerota archaeon]MDG7020556.1 adenosylhomocysteinase [Nitrososphaerota archaeon]